MFCFASENSASSARRNRQCQDRSFGCGKSRACIGLNIYEVNMKHFLTLGLVLLFNLGIYSQDEIVLITHNNYLIGGTRNGKWLKEADVLTNIGKPTKFIGFDSFIKTKPSEIYGTFDTLGCGANYFYFGKTAKIPENVFGDDSLKPILAIGANAKWNPLPRVPKKLDQTNKTYQKIALDFLRTKGMKTTNVKLERVVSIDLEGDGTDKIFIEATNYKNKNGEIGGTARAGNYSFVLMRKIVSGKPKNSLVEGEFNPKKPKIEDYVSEFDLSAFADLNGDGKMELILKSLYSYGGQSTEIYELEKNTLNKVLSVECGD